MIEQAIDKLKEKRYRITPQRRTILEKIFHAQEPLTVAQIWDQVRICHDAIGLDTIYRNINVLVELEYLIPIEGPGKTGTRYELADGHHHHITCLQCGATACIDACPVNHHFVNEINHHGFELVRHRIELFGLCAGCKNRAGKNDV